MQQSGLRASAHLNPRPKPGSTASSGLVAPRVQRSREPSRQRSNDEDRDDRVRAENGNDRSAEALVRRVLCPLSQAELSQSRPLHELLPPLTSQNEVDLQLYTIIAIVMRDFVYSWYGRITPDHTFVEETIRIIAHCTRDLEQRFRRVDLESLVLDEIPTLVGRHISGLYHVLRSPMVCTDLRASFPNCLLEPGGADCI